VRCTRYNSFVGILHTVHVFSPDCLAFLHQ